MLLTPSRNSFICVQTDRRDVRKKGMSNERKEVRDGLSHRACSLLFFFPFPCCCRSGIERIHLICSGSAYLKPITALLFFLLFLLFSYPPLASLARFSSGIMSLFFCGIVLAHYCYYSLSPAAQAAAVLAFRGFSALCETLTFVYLGLTLGRLIALPSALLLLSRPFSFHSFSLQIVNVFVFLGLEDRTC